MNGGIYLLRGEDELLEMREQPYDSEDILQSLIERFPSLLAGDQFGADTPRQWLLIKREAGLPDDVSTAGRWSVDHLFLDQEAVPTLVEVKRSTDTRIRREVIGQMFDYAANAVVYWPIEQLREMFVRRCERDGRNPDEEVQTLVGLERDIEDYWQRADENLRAGNVRLVFVADEIPRELRRVIEFLNSQMNPAEVIGIEVKQYVGEGVKTLVPRVVGQTAAVEARKGRRTGSERREWDEDSFFADVEERHDTDVARTVRDLYDWTLTQGMRPQFGMGGKFGSWTPVIDARGTEYAPIRITMEGRGVLYFMFSYLRSPFDQESVRLDLLRRVNEIPGVSFEPDVINASKSVRLSTLAAEPRSLQALKNVVAWVAATATSFADGS
jgi:hypothetical protein